MKVKKDNTNVYKIVKDYFQEVEQILNVLWIADHAGNTVRDNKVMICNIEFNNGFIVSVKADAFGTTVYKNSVYVPSNLTPKEVATYILGYILGTRHQEEGVQINMNR